MESGGLFVRACSTIWRMVGSSGSTKTPAPIARRAMEVTAFVGVWISSGVFLRLDANRYLLLGVPLTALFQRFVRQQPIRALWVREAPRFDLDKTGWLLGIMLAIVPARTFVAALMRGEPSVALWGLSAVCGALAAAYSLRNFQRETFRGLLSCAAIAGPIGIAIMAGAAVLRHGGSPISPLIRVQTFGSSLSSYFPVCFLLEEVSFRGALDAHLHHPGEPRPWASAILVSALWGLWHLPIVPGEHRFAVAVSLILVHCAIGIPLSFFWRRSGNLAVTAFSHALIDAVRNAILL